MIYRPSHTIEQSNRFQMGDNQGSRVRFKQDEIHTKNQPSHLERVDNQFPEIWKASIKQYEADTKNNLMHASRGLADITSADELLGIIDDKQKNFMEYRKRGAKIKGALKPVLDIVGPLADAAGEGVALVFPPGKVIFVTVKLLVDATHNVKAHYDAIIDTFERMESFLLHCCMYLGHGGNISDDLRQKLGKILVHLLSIIGIVTKEMKKGQLRHFIHGVFTKDSAVQDALARLDYLTKEEGQVVQAATYQEVRHVSRGMDQMGQKFDKAYENIMLDKCYSWLAATSDPWIYQNAAQEKLSESSTGQWFFEDQRFMEWKDQRHSSMWLYGKPGGGKTVLCSTIIKMLQDYTKSRTSCALVFFYFDFKDSAKQTFLDMLRSLLRQLCSQDLAASTVLKKLYADHDNGARQPSRQDLQATLGDILGCFDDVYIVLDALDECHEDDRNRCLLSFLESTMLNGHSSVHFLATSRNDPDIMECLEKATHVVNLGDQLMHGDIEAHLSAVFERQSPFKKFNDNIKQEIKEILLGRANGMFLWVECQLKELKNCSTVSILRRKLHNLPSTLEDTYARILSKENCEDTEVLHLMLSWIAFAIEPLTRSELDAAVKLSYEEIHSESGDELLLLYPSSMLGAISSLVDITDNDIVKFCHSSIKEYVISDSAKTKYYHIDQSLCFNMMAESCLYFLLQAAVNIPEIKSYIEHHTLEHIQQAKISSENKLHNYIVKFFQENKQSTIKHDICKIGPTDTIPPDSSAWCMSAIGRLDILKLLHDKCSIEQSALDDALHAATEKNHYDIVQWLVEHGADVHKLYEGTSLLMWACKNGNEDIFNYLLEKGADVHVQVGYYGTALITASWEGHTFIVNTLLSEGAEVNAQDSDGYSALLLASLNGHTSVVELLLAKKTDINACNSKGDTALMLASHNGHTSVVELLIAKEADINLQGNHGCTALMHASCNGHISIVEILLAQEADVNACASEGYTAFMAASWNGHASVVEMLLEKGADVNACLEDGDTALIFASENGYTSIAKMLLDNGADINAQTSEGDTALIRVSLNGHTSVVEMLLAKKTDINACNSKDDTALTTASQNGHTSIVEMLLAKEADVNVHVSDGFTALMQASLNGHISIVEMLLAQGTDVNACASEGNTALMAASQNGHASVVEMLIAKKADVNLQATDGYTALMLASEDGHTFVVEMLLAKKADVNLQATDGYTALMLASESGHISVVEMLLAQEADVNACATNGFTALIPASWNGHTFVVEMLLAKGANVNACATDDATALICASQNGHASVIEILLEKGADVNACNNYGGTALIYASQTGHTSVVEMLLSKKADINFHGTNYGTALICASQNGHASVVDMLLAKGANVNACATDDVTALICASQNGHASVVEMLLSKKADVNLHGTNYGTALRLASQNGHASVVEMLLAKKADVNLQATDGYTALMRASQNGHTSIVEMLLAKGADVNLQASDSFTAIMLASQNGHTSVVEMLLEKGADVNACLEDGDTALIFASENGYTSIAKMLLDNGADINAQTSDGDTVLTVAGDNQEMIELLQRYGASAEQ
ncbi:hypothetical protein EVG20_g53 [Dentipellis fragilis]|uniref:NACHT domain-containing protein n=1 Tax=Dentipellis fragilis TaxID=205917 RepID=A0A4Y9ZFK7_9AGAM|nr:hypothetical protein EVG20_g53 [Dentipellis fragilis]